jgi:hypothetical protein
MFKYNLDALQIQVVKSGNIIFENYCFWDVAPSSFMKIDKHSRDAVSIISAKSLAMVFFLYLALYQSSVFKKSLRFEGQMFFCLHVGGGGGREWI